MRPEQTCDSIRLMLKGKSVNLRTVRSRDLDTFIDLTSDIESRGEFFPLKMPTETSVKTRFNQDGYWSDDSKTLLIVEKHTDRIVGMIVAFKPVHYHDSLELGYIVFNAGDRGKGYVPEAVKLFSKYIFDSRPIFRIQLQIEPANEPSCKVAEKCGFVREGTMRRALVIRGVPSDIDVYSLIREDFDKLKSQWISEFLGA